jgi:hypothetical protein
VSRRVVWPDSKTGEISKPMSQDGHGGSIEVASELGKGTSIAVLVPPTRPAMVHTSGSMVARADGSRGNRTVAAVHDAAGVTDRHK